jgi:hypothetical protein
MTERRVKQESRPLRVYLEEGRRRTFAMAVDWPGWGRSARDGEGAIEALLAYHPRYLPVVRDAGLDLPSAPPLPVAALPSAPPLPVAAPDRAITAGVVALVDVLARVTGNATTDFGAPGVVPPFDHLGWGPDGADRQTWLLAAAWAYFDAVAAAAPPGLRKGPRGGGRDRDAIVDHVLGTEPAYVRKAGLQLTPPADRNGQQAMRRQVLELLGGSSGRAGTASGWPAPYAVRRLAWHALDHAWEIEDRSQRAES